MFYRINWKLADKEVILESAANAAPATIAGYTSLGTFEHGPDKDDDTQAQLPGMQEFPENHVLYHHVQEALYHVGVQDMQSVDIFLNPPRTLSIGTGTLSVAVGANSAPLTVTITPDTADKQVTFSSSDETKATVNYKGVVHGVAAGTAVIHAASTNHPSKTATRNVTVTA